jgi:hypothetical protein
VPLVLGTRLFRGRGTPPRPPFAAERLEDRTLLTTSTIDTLTDVLAVDGKVSLREAVQAARTNAAVNEAAAFGTFG